jgi:hypothetical protein
VDGPINNYMVQQITEPEVHVLRVWVRKHFTIIT